MKPTLYLLMGLPGSGKTTVAKTLQSITGAKRLTSDEERVKLIPKPRYDTEEHDFLYEHLNLETKHLLKKGYSVIYDANLNRKEHRQEKYQLAKSLGLTCVLIWVKTSVSVAKNRRINDTSHHHLVPVNETPAKMFDRVASVVEPPNNEPFVQLDGTKITEDYVKKQLGL